MQTRPAAPQSEQRKSSLGYLPGLDGLRAVSVLAVLAFHHYFIGGHEPGFAPGGFLGVEVFFVVSGYLITALLLAERRKTGRVSLKRFWMRRARRLLPALFVMLAVVVLYALVFLPDSIDKLKSDSIAALTYTSNWWLVISHQSYASEAGRPALLKHLWSLAIEEQFYLLWPPLLILGLRKLGRKRTARHDAGRRARVDDPDGDRRDREHQRRVLLARHALVGTAARLRDGVLLRAVPNPRAARTRRARRDGHHRARSACSCCCGRSRTSRIRSCQSGDLSVFRGGFLLVDIATLLVIASVVHPRSDAGPCSAARRCAGSACARTASISGTTRSSASPGPASTFRCTAGSCSCCGSCCRSAPPTSRTATSRRRFAAARSAATSIGCGSSTACTGARVLRRGLAVVVGVDAHRRRARREPRRHARSRRRADPGLDANASKGDKGDARRRARHSRQLKHDTATTTTRHDHDRPDHHDEAGHDHHDAPARHRSDHDTHDAAERALARRSSRSATP